MTKPTLVKENITIQDFLSKKTMNFDIVCNVKTKNQVMSKIQHSMMHSRPKMNNHQMDLSAISTGFKVDGKNYEFKEITPKTCTLPTTISKEVRAAGISDVSWTNVDDLPMSANKQIKEIGNRVFESFGLKKGTGVNCISSLTNSDLLNSNLELNSVLSFLDKNTIRVFDEPQTQIYNKRGMEIEGYAPKIQLYNTNDKAYLVVLEPEGHGMEGKFIYEFERDVTLQLKNDKKISHKNN